MFLNLNPKKIKFFHLGKLGETPPLFYLGESVQAGRWKGIYLIPLLALLKLIGLVLQLFDKTFSSTLNHCPR